MANDVEQNFSLYKLSIAYAVLGLYENGIELRWFSEGRFIILGFKCYKEFITLLELECCHVYDWL
jgi:hypothetical protein